MAMLCGLGQLSPTPPSQYHRLSHSPPHHSSRVFNDHKTSVSTILWWYSFPIQHDFDQQPINATSKLTSITNVTTSATPGHAYHHLLLHCHLRLTQQISTYTQTVTVILHYQHL